MRQIAVTLAFALLSLAFAPGPLPRADRSTERQRGMRECQRRLEELDVRWHVESRKGERCVVFTIYLSDAQLGPCVLMGREDLLATLREIVAFATQIKSLDRVRYTIAGGEPA